MEMDLKRKERKLKGPPTTIRMEPEVAEYLRLLSERLQRDRTFVVNAIISEHAQRHRGKLPDPLRIISI
jgi:hypothetical protein